MPEDLVTRLRYLVSLNEPRNGGPYQGHAAEVCVESMRQAADVISDLLSSCEAIVDLLRKEAPGTPLNSHKYDHIGAAAYAAIAKAKG